MSITIWRNATIATMATATSDYGLIEAGALICNNDTLHWVGPEQALDANLPCAPEAVAAVHDCGGRLLTPGLIDCHTHLVFGGNRAREFELRLQGASYADIARQGGGILGTVAATRAASEDELLASALPRLDALLAEGVTTVEIKSGYGLETATELKQLRVARRLGQLRPVTVQTTFLGAHALPPEFAQRADAYIDELCQHILPAVAEAGLADAVDAFCENIGFSPAQVERVFQCAQTLQLPLKLHAEQLSNLGGAALAARYQALSADHLEYLDEAGVAAMAAAGTVAVLLPGAFYCLRETQLPPLDLLRRYQVPIALATDLNPGSSPVHSLLLILNMACTLFRMTPAEAFQGITCNAARALGIAQRVGILTAGKQADFVVWDVTEPAALAYQIGLNPCRQIVRAGRMVTAE